MPTDKKLKNLVFNVLNKDQFESESKNPDELYAVTDDTSFPVPDYANGIALPTPTTTLQTYECPDDGYIIYAMDGFYGQPSSLYINDNEIFNIAPPNNAFYMPVNGMLPVKKGDVVKYRSHAYDPRISWYPIRK